MSPIDIVIIAACVVGAALAFRKFWINSKGGSCSGCSHNKSCCGTEGAASCPAVAHTVEDMAKRACSCEDHTDTHKD